MAEITAPIVPVIPIEPGTQIDPAVTVDPAAIDTTPVDPVVVDPVAPVTPAAPSTELVLLKTQYEQLKNSQSGETRKNTELQNQLNEMRAQFDEIKLSKMTEKEKTEFEINKLRDEIRIRDEQIIKAEFLVKVKEAADNVLIKHELNPEDMDFIYDENIEVMEKKGEMLKIRDKKIIDEAMEKLRGAQSTGRPGQGIASPIVDNKTFTDTAGATEIYKKIKLEQGEEAAKKWWDENKKF